MPSRVALSKRAIKRIKQAVDGLFTRAKIRLLGSPRGDKKIVFNFRNDVSHREDLSLPGVYDKASHLEGVKPNKKIKDNLMTVAEGYLDAHREKAKVEIVNNVQNYLAEAELKGVDTDVETVLAGELYDTLGKVSRGVHEIHATEMNRAKNLSSVDAIVKVNAASGIDEPIVFFVVVRDGNACGECMRLHLLEDGVTPRVWKLSEVGHKYHKRGDETPKMAGLHPHCFVGDTRLHTDRGLLTIKELYDQGGLVSVVVDNRVKNRKDIPNQLGVDLPGVTWFYRHAQGASLKPATAVYETGVQDCLLIELSNGSSLEVSCGHEMWVDDDNSGVKIRADRLKIGDKIPLLSGEGAWGNDHFPELAELMGNLLGDGSLYSTAIWNFFGADIPYGKKLKKLASKFSKQLDPTFLSKRKEQGKYSVDARCFNSEKLARIFKKEFGLSKKPRRVPNRLWRADRDTVCAFLRGLYAANGHYEKTPSIVLAQNDLVFLKEIQQLLSNFGIRSNIFNHGSECTKDITYADGRTFSTKRKPCWRLAIGGTEQVKQFSLEIGMGVPKKQSALERRIEENKNKKPHGACRTSRIVKITKTGKKQTYCLTEPMSNTVTANGIVTGQCRCTMVTLMPGYGFKGGTVIYIGPDHDEYAIQHS